MKRVLATAASALVMVPLLQAPARAAPEPILCHAQSPTIVITPTQQYQTFYGTKHADVIVIEGDVGYATIYTLGGADSVCDLSPGSNAIWAGKGNDFVRTRKALYDQVYGGPGANDLKGGPQWTFLYATHTAAGGMYQLGSGGGQIFAYIDTVGNTLDARDGMLDEITNLSVAGGNTCLADAGDQLIGCS